MGIAREGTSWVLKTAVVYEESSGENEILHGFREAVRDRIQGSAGRYGIAGILEIKQAGIKVA